MKRKNTLAVALGLIFSLFPLALAIAGWVWFGTDGGFAHWWGWLIAAGSLAASLRWAAIVLTTIYSATLMRAVGRDF